MAKQKRKKKSKTEQRLLNQYYYQKRKLKPFFNDLKKANELDGRKYHSTEKFKKYFVSKKSKTGRGRKRSTIKNAIINEATKISNKVNAIEKKLLRFKKKRAFEAIKKGKNDLVVSIGRVWERKELENEVFGSDYIRSVNGIIISTHADKVQEYLDSLYLLIDSQKTIKIVTNMSTGNAEISVQDAKKTNKSR